MIYIFVIYCFCSFSDSRIQYHSQYSIYSKQYLRSSIRHNYSPNPWRTQRSGDSGSPQVRWSRTRIFHAQTRVWDSPGLPRTISVSEVRSCHSCTSRRSLKNNYIESDSTLGYFKNRQLLCCAQTYTTTPGKLGRAVGFGHGQAVKVSVFKLYCNWFVSGFTQLSVSI